MFRCCFPPLLFLILWPWKNQQAGAFFAFAPQCQSSSLGRPTQLFPAERWTIKGGVFVQGGIQNVDQRSDRLGPSSMPEQQVLHAANHDPEASGSGREHKTWDERIEDLKKYNNEFGTVNVPDTHVQNKDEWASVATWLQNVRRHQGMLSQEKLDQLTSMGVIFKGVKKEKEDQQWAEMFDRLKQYNITHGHNRVSQKDPVDRSLGVWVRNQRRQRKVGVLKPERIEMLNSINFEWQLRSGGRTITPKEEKIWFKNLANLTKFHEENGHYWPPTRSSNATIRKLGDWTTFQRVQKRQGTLEEDREKALEWIGFPWDDKENRESKWFAKFEKVKEIAEQRKRDGLEGSSLAKSVLGENMYQWVYAQRLLYLKGDLDPKRKSLLESIGFDWRSEDTTM